ncbi:DUF1003 domain-containing protein [Candidatus Pacearchaeota archaeon]|nr:DUF1003 domain-containing protein [Candidatus Pacearchaeota archaeon]
MKKEANYIDSKQLFHLGGKKRLTVGQKAADAMANFGGSWVFIALFFIFLALWISTNAYLLSQYGKDVFDPYPFILLNLFLSCLAAIQAPIILMSQNRANERDRLRAEYDYAVNRKAEKEIREIKNDLSLIKRKLSVK